MADIDFLLQALTPSNHSDELKRILKIPQLKSVLISVAFAQELGVDTLASAIGKASLTSRVYIGIRNDITSLQAVLRLLTMGVELYAVDVASRSPIYHPKIYIVRSNAIAKAIIGSANLTFNGLHNNIEASVVVTLDLKNQSDRKFLESIEDEFRNLTTDYPQHVFRIRNAKHARDLFKTGRLADEVTGFPPTTKSSLRTKERDSLQRMKLFVTARPKKPAPTKATRKTKRKSTATIGAPSAGSYAVVWTSKGLTERDLNIPTGSKTNPTGSMGWKKGAQVGIDQRRYFRNHVFQELTWSADKTSTWERASASLLPLD